MPVETFRGVLTLNTTMIAHREQHRFKHLSHHGLSKKQIFNLCLFPKHSSCVLVPVHIYLVCWIPVQAEPPKRSTRQVCQVENCKIARMLCNLEETSRRPKTRYSKPQMIAHSCSREKSSKCVGKCITCSIFLVRPFLTVVFFRQNK